MQNRTNPAIIAFYPYYYYRIIITVGEGIPFLRLAVSSRVELSAEVLFLRKQLAFYQERQVQGRQSDTCIIVDLSGNCGFRANVVFWINHFNL